MGKRCFNRAIPILKNAQGAAAGRLELAHTECEPERRNRTRARDKKGQHTTSVNWEIRRKEYIMYNNIMLAGLSSYVVMYAKKRNNFHNSAAHSGKAVGVKMSYYNSKWGRPP